MIATQPTTLAELIADAKAAERQHEVERRGWALRRLTALETAFSAALGERVMGALAAAGYVVVGVPGSPMDGIGLGPHAWLRPVDGAGGGGCGAMGVHASSHGGVWDLYCDDVASTVWVKGVAGTQLPDAVLSLVGRVEKARAGVARRVGGRLDVTG